MTTGETEIAVLRQQAQRLLDENRLPEARAVCARACERYPDDAPLLHLLGSALARDGEVEGAVTAWRSALQLDPDNAQLLAKLGRALALLPRLDEAAAALAQAVRLQPDDPAAHNDLGSVLARLGRHEEAVQCYRAALAAAPNAVVHYNLGTLLLQQQRLAEAAAHLRAARALNPESAEICNNLGNALRYQGLYDEAEAAYRAAAAARPEHPMAYVNLGVLHIIKGQAEAALDHFRRARALDPDHQGAVAGEAHCRERLGEPQHACALLAPLLGRRPLEPYAVTVFAAAAGALGRSDEALRLIEDVLAGGHADVHARISLHFSAGRLLDRMGDYDRAFEYYHKGNGLAQRPFDSRAHASIVNDLIAAYGPEFMAAAPRNPVRQTRPIFIVGMPRSGSSLVEQILASHPLVFGAGELLEMERIAAELAGEIHSSRPYPGCLADLTAGDCGRLAARYLARLDTVAPAAAPYVTDKLPGNFTHLGLIALLFPGARVIHCVRDPLDTCLSCYFQHFAGTQAYSYDLGQLGRYYGQYRRLMAHWRRVLDLPIMDLQYEALVAEPERWSRELLAFCGLDWDERCLSFHRTRRAVATASYDQVRRPVYRSSVGRWRHYAAHIGPLRLALGGLPPAQTEREDRRRASPRR